MTATDIDKTKNKIDKLRYCIWDQTDKKVELPFHGWDSTSIIFTNVRSINLLSSVIAHGATIMLWGR